MDCTQNPHHNLNADNKMHFNVQFGFDWSKEKTNGEIHYYRNGVFFGIEPVIFRK
jgi:hypothetical protein